MYDRILLPTDGSDAAECAIELALDTADRHGATLHVLYVMNTTTHLGRISPGMVVESLETEGERAVEVVLDHARAAGFEAIEIEITHGAPHETILDYASDHEIGLIVTGTRGRTGFDRYVIGSTTERVVRTAPVPVLTVGVPATDLEE